MVAEVNFSKEKEFFVSRGKVANPRKRKMTKNQIETIQKTPTKVKKGARGNAYQHTNSGARYDLGGLVVRSNWEANFVRVLNLFKIHFLFEPTEFKFPPSPRTGASKGYLPDFYLPHSDEYVEIKGYLDGRGRSKLRNFKKHYPEEFEKLSVVVSKSSRANILFFQKLGVKNILFYEHISQLYGDKINWEGRR